MEDCGSLRRDVGGVGDDDVLLLVMLLVVFAVFSEVWVVLLCFSLRGASLIRPASLRWWSSRRLRMRRAYPSVR